MVFVNDAVIVDYECDNNTEISFSTDSVTTTDVKPEEVFKVTVSNEKRFYLADPKNILDLEYEILNRYPELRVEILTFYYYGNFTWDMSKR